ncbi:MAG: hypothetical protein Q4C95_02840 [Planctomycetia bacterium]|nr:hypothetical protein [Planctomycetia bacterium]
MTISDFADRLDQTVFIVERRIPICWMNPRQEIDFQTASSGINQICWVAEAFIRPE